MRNKILIVSAIIVMGLAITLSFNEMVMGSPASLLNAIVTIVYIVFWIVFIILARKSKDLLIYSSVISAISLMISLITLLVNIYDWTVPIVIPLVAIFLTPFYWVRGIFNHGFILSTITIAVICAIWFVSSIVLYKRIK